MAKVLSYTPTNRPDIRLQPSSADSRKRGLRSGGVHIRFSLRRRHSLKQPSASAGVSLFYENIGHTWPAGER
jgi:hypothetical protein